MKSLANFLSFLLLSACAGIAPNGPDYVKTANQVPVDVEKRLREIGPISAPEPTRPLYAPLQPVEPFANIVVKRDLRYGAAERHRLDVFSPTGVSNKPVLLFMHGGAYVGGDKHLAGSPFYSNIGAWAARNGMVGVNMTYRLAPQAKWPSAQEDIGRAIAWIKANAAAQGGDPNRIYLMGHSAGASHVANYMSHSQFHGAAGPGVAGAIIVSAFYDFETLNATGTFFQYHGNDKAQNLQRSSLPGLIASKVPMLFAVAEHDTPDFLQQAEVLRKGFCSAGRCQRIVMLTGHSHMSEVYSINTADTGLSSEILGFIKP
ncbi:MAG: alpha/beta hydrolase [Betaproteobacteria bacterium]